MHQQPPPMGFNFPPPQQLQHSQGYPPPPSGYLGGGPPPHFQMQPQQPHQFGGYPPPPPPQYGDMQGRGGPPPQGSANPDFGWAQPMQSGITMTSQGGPRSEQQQQQSKDAPPVPAKSTKPEPSNQQQHQQQPKSSITPALPKARDSPAPGEKILQAANSSVATKSMSASAEQVRDLAKNMSQIRVNGASANERQSIKTASSSQEPSSILPSISSHLAQMRRGGTQRFTRGGGVINHANVPIHRNGSGSGSIPVPNTDYDFDAANAKFNKGDVVKEALARGEKILPDAAKWNPTLESSAVAGESTGISSAIDDPSSTTLKKSFFDSFTGQAQNATAGEGQGDTAADRRSNRFKEEKNRNYETFGQSTPDMIRGHVYRGGRGGRGRGRGQERGRGRGRGGGGGGVGGESGIPAPDMRTTNTEYEVTT